MKPQLVSPEKPRTLEEKAGEAVGGMMAQARSPRMRARWVALDQFLTALGNEVASLLIIFLALAILCAPVGLGLVATYLLATWVAQAAGSAFPGWGVAILLLSFLCRYVWGIRLQRASRRAAEALIASKVP